MLLNRIVLCIMHNKINEFQDIFDDSLTDEAVGIKDFNPKEHSNKGYSFPQYIPKYNGFVPDCDDFIDSVNLNPQLTSKDVQRIIDSECINNYPIEFNYFTPVVLCETKGIERIFSYFNQNIKIKEIESSKEVSKSPEKENHKNNQSLTKSISVSNNELENCHSKLFKDSESLFLKPVEVFFYSQVDLIYKICIEDIQQCRDSRTTCMIKNIPNKYTQKMLIDLLNEHHFGCYDFVYLRMDFKNKCNVGYAFVNLADPLCVVSLYKKVNNKGWKKFSSNKIAQLTYASIQGLENLKRKFRRSSVMQEQESFRPKIFYSDGPLRGFERSDF